MKRSTQLFILTILFTFLFIGNLTWLITTGKDNNLVAGVVGTYLTLLTLIVQFYFRKGESGVDTVTLKPGGGSNGGSNGGSPPVVVPPSVTVTGNVTPVTIPPVPVESKPEPSKPEKPTAPDMNDYPTDELPKKFQKEVKKWYDFVTSSPAPIIKELGREINLQSIWSMADDIFSPTLVEDLLSPLECSERNKVAPTLWSLFGEAKREWVEYNAAMLDYYGIK